MYGVGDELRNPQSPPCVTVLVSESSYEGDEGERNDHIRHIQVQA
jgi:hypothetical protein